MKEEDVEADEKEEENFQQDTTIRQIYSFVCLHTAAYHEIHPKSPQLCYP